MLSKRRGLKILILPFRQDQMLKLVQHDSKRHYIFQTYLRCESLRSFAIALEDKRPGQYDGQAGCKRAEGMTPNV